MFGVTTGQDYSISFISASDVVTVSALASNHSNLTNEKWQSLYDTKYVPNAGDLYLIIDVVSVGVELEPSTSPPSWTYFLSTEFPGSTDPIIPGGPNITISVDITLDATYQTYSTNPIATILRFPVENATSMPRFTWPWDSILVNASTSFVNASTSPPWKGIDDQGWFSTDSTLLHVAYGLSTHVPQGSSIQIARVFIIIVIICNLLKTIAIFFTLRDSVSQKRLTL